MTDMAPSISSLYAIPTIASDLRTGVEVRDRILEVKNDSFGTRIIVPSNRLIRTEKVLISNKVPEISDPGSSILSPCLTGFSIIKKIPEIKFETTD